MSMRSPSSMVVTFCALVAVLWSCAQIARADYTYGEPTLIGPPVSTGDTEYGACISADGLELYFDAWSNGQTDLWVATRATKDDAWGARELLGTGVNDPSRFEWSPRISADGLELYFERNEPGSYTNFSIYVARRQSPHDAWQAAEKLGSSINGPGNNTMGSLSADGLELYYSNSSHLSVATRTTKGGEWTQSKVLAPNVSGEYPSISPDGLRLLFSSSTLSGGMGNGDIWMMTRVTPNANWSAPVNLGPAVNTVITENRPWILHDGSALLFTAGGPFEGSRPGGAGSADVWQARALPIVDFNGDGNVDGQDVLVMARHWGQKFPLCDIGPTAWGDGIVDVEDLTVLAEHIGQEVVDSSLVLHWALDETEGATVHDSAGTNDGITVGDASWQADGKIGGALAFDGQDDFVTSGTAVVNPAAGPFSFIAWVKGRAKSRVIASQTPGVDWLYLNKDGMLATDLKASGKDGKTLVSSASLLDDQWHRVVFTWDGTNRVLGVDGVEVARDTQPSLAASSGKLNVGAGKTLAATSRWSGLIDDIRIYNRAVQP
jgi:hypothetical protein